MTRDKFRALADSIICYRVQNITGHNYLRLKSYCENTFCECVGFDESDDHWYLADLICTGIANAFLAGTEEPR